MKQPTDWTKERLEFVDELIGTVLEIVSESFPEFGGYDFNDHEMTRDLGRDEDTGQIIRHAEPEEFLISLDEALARCGEDVLKAIAKELAHPRVAESLLRLVERGVEAGAIHNLDCVDPRDLDDSLDHLRTLEEHDAQMCLFDGGRR